MGEHSKVADLMLDPKRGKPDFIEQVRSDQLVDVVMRLAMEVSTLRDRLDVHEALAQEQGFGGPEVVDAYQLSEQAQNAQAQRRELWVQRIVHDLTS